MKKQKWLRLTAFVLVLLLVSGALLTAGAAHVVGDMNGDGKITAFDAQMIAEHKAGLRTLDKAQQMVANNSTVSRILDFILGKSQADLGDLDGDNVFEIYSADGLFEMAQNPQQDYILMADIDLASSQWTPVIGFSGSFNGNGYTISNVSITTGTPSCYNTKGPAFNMGFFGDPTADSVITDLHLRNVTIVASEEAQYLGLLAGTSRGLVTGCTATGMIIDSRPTHGTTDDAKTWIGVLVGRIPNVSAGQTPSSVIGGTTLSVTDSANVATTDGLSADVKFQIADRDGINLIKDVSQSIGLVGWYPSGATVSGIYRDSSNSSTLVSADIQARQDKMITYMNAMGTVRWTPAEDLTMISEKGTGRTYYAGTIYTGLPYTHNNGSLQRFLSAMDTQDENGVYTAQSGLGDSIYYVDDAGIGGYDGFAQLMGNSCSGAVGWAWLQASPVLTHLPNNQSNPYHGGVYPRGTKSMLPTEATRTQYGIYPVGQWSDFRMADPDTGKYTDVPYDATKAAYSCTDETYSYEVLANNDATTLLEAYAMARRADAVVAYAEQWYNSPTPGGHVRLLTADPVVIRNTRGVIDADKSYMITTEQGAELKTSTWLVNHRYSFRELLDDPSDPNASSQKRTYLPITIRALHDTELRDSYISKDSVTGPTSGRLYSNYRFVSSTVTVKNGSRVIYCGEAFTGVGRSYAESMGQFNWAYLADHTEGFTAAAKAANLKSGTYTFSVSALLSDGKKVDVITDQIFSYQAPA